MPPTTSSDPDSSKLDANRPHAPPLVSATALRAEHANLEVVYDALLNAYRSGDWAVVREQWNVFEATLRRHMAFEEEHVLPAFREAHRADTDALLAEHARLRNELETLGVNIELHSVPERDIRALLERLIAHAERENVSLYRWLAARRGSPT